MEEQMKELKESLGLNNPALQAALADKMKLNQDFDNVMDEYEDD